MQQPIYREISLRPQTAQFFIDELPLLLLCPVGLVYGGMENAPLASIATLLAVLLSLILIYRLIYLKRIRYHVGSEQLTAEHACSSAVSVTSNCTVWWTSTNSRACCSRFSD